MARRVFLGVDASLRSLGLCAVPSEWDGDFDLVAFNTLQIKLAEDATAKERILGMIALAADVRRFAEQTGVTDVCYEDSLPRDAFQIKKLSKLLGYIERALARIALYAEPVNQSSARSYFLGGLPRADRKKLTLAAVDELTDVFQWPDEKDAFVTVNCFMRGVPGVFTYWKEKPPKAKRARKAAAVQGALALESLPKLAQGWDAL